jgi:hypothetical protein
VRFEPERIMCRDLDGDGMMDVIASAELEFYAALNRTEPAVSRDRDRDRVPDECEPLLMFHRGDANGDGAMDVSDGLCILAFLFAGEEEPPCLEAGDANNDGVLDCSDSLVILGYLFLGTRPPDPPGPPPESCGADTDPPGGMEDLGCLAYPNCV